LLPVSFERAPCQNYRNRTVARHLEEDRMGIDDLVNKGKELFEQNKDKIGEALSSEQAEDISDKVLDSVADLAKKVLPDEHDATVDGIRENIDKNIGNK
jgi:uncharacterized Fe-S cluster-containing protein